jgi:hypothetical protein
LFAKDFPKLLRRPSGGRRSIDTNQVTLMHSKPVVAEAIEKQKGPA